jgi:hypothetical protein
MGLALCLTSSTGWAAPPEEDEAPAEPVPPEETVEGPTPPSTPSPLEPTMVDGRRVPPLIGDKHSVQYSNLIAPRINPLGLENRLWIGYQYRLYNKDKTILNGSNLAIFFRPILNPAVALIGATVQVQPAAVFRLRATYSYVQWFGTFQFFQSYESPYDDYSEQRIDEQSEVGENYVTGGHQVELEALVQAKVKGLVIRSSTYGIYNYYPNVRGDDDVFYDPRYDLMVPTQGWMLHNDTDLLWQHEFKGAKKNSLLAGARATTLMPFFKKDVYEEGDTPKNPVGPQFRLGPAFGYVFYDRPEKRFNKPTLLLLPQWNVQHRFRTGRDVISAYPTIVIAFAFSGQLWGKS